MKYKNSREVKVSRISITTVLLSRVRRKPTKRKMKWINKAADYRRKQKAYARTVSCSVDTKQ